MSNPIHEQRDLAPDIRMLNDDEVDAVSGGLVVIAIVAVMIGLLMPAIQK